MESDLNDEIDHRTKEESRLNISIILLAAGSSSRMGQSKQLLDIHGEPLLIHSIKRALECAPQNVIVILGANEQAHRDVIRDLPVTIIANHFWKSGMGSSIKSGLNYLIRKSPETDAVIIMVCDQPGLTTEHLLKLIETFKQKRNPITASSYSETIGVPALFARTFFSNILMLKDDQGAKKILEQFTQHVIPIAFPEGVYDLDTAEDYQNYLGKKLNKK